MDNLERTELSAWVQASVDLLAPPAEWEPEFRRQMRRYRHSRLKRYTLVAAMAAALIVMATIPPVQVLAQKMENNGWRRMEEIWDWVTLVSRPPSPMVELGDAIKALMIRQTASPTLAAGAGFTPSLPDATILSAAPRLSVTGPQSFTSAAQVTMQIAATVNAIWSNVTDQRGGTQWASLTLTQGPLPVVTGLPSMNLAAFATETLRTAGMRNAGRVERLAHLPTTLPALLYGYLSPSQFVSARDVDLRSGPATLIEEFTIAQIPGNPGIDRITLLWTVRNRAYLLTGIPKNRLTDLLSFDLAATLASEIDLANSIN